MTSIRLLRHEILVALLVLDTHIDMAHAGVQNDDASHHLRSPDEGNQRNNAPQNFVNIYLLPKARPSMLTASAFLLIRPRVLLSLPEVKGTT